MALFRSRGLLVVAGGAFVALAAAVVLLGALPADAAIRDALLGWTSPSIVAVLRIVNRAGDWRVLFPGTLLLFVIFAQARARWWIWVGLMVAAPLAEWLAKRLIGRPRPEDLSFGFPSGHATAAAAFFGALAYLSASLPSATLRTLLRVIALAAITLVAVARVVLRAHWPSDVLGGVALGLALASAAALLAASSQDGEIGER